MAYGAWLLTRLGESPREFDSHILRLTWCSAGGLAQFRPWGTCPENRGGVDAPVWVRDPPPPQGTRAMGRQRSPVLALG